MTEHALREPSLSRNPSLGSPLRFDDLLQVSGPVSLIHEDIIYTSVDAVKEATPMDGNSFGRWLQRQLDRRDWTQADFMRAGGFSRSGVSSWIRGERIPDPKYCDLIADALHVDVETVLRKAGHLPEEPADDPPELVELFGMMRRVDWNADRLAGVRSILRGYLEMDRHLKGD